MREHRALGKRCDKCRRQAEVFPTVTWRQVATARACFWPFCAALICLRNQAYAQRQSNGLVSLLKFVLGRFHFRLIIWKPLPLFLCTKKNTDTHITNQTSYTYFYTSQQLKYVAHVHPPPWPMGHAIS